MALGVTQPAVSSSIRKLENELGVKLLTRGTRGSVPTKFGKAFYSSALAMSNISDSALRKLEILQDPSAGMLRIITSPSFPAALTSDLLAHMIETYPRLSVQHIAGQSDESIEAQLLSEVVDIALCANMPAKMSKAIEAIEVARAATGMFLASAHIAKDADTVSMERLFEDFTWISMRDDMRAPPATKTNVRDARVSQRNRVVVDDVAVIKNLTLTTRSLGIFPLSEAMPELKAGQLVEAYLKEVPHVDRPLFALTKAETEKSLALESLLEYLASRDEELGNNPGYRRIEIAQNRPT